MSLFFHSSRAARKEKRRFDRRRRRRNILERLEPRVVLNAVPIGMDDPWYATAQNSALTIGSSEVTLLDNDWDPEGSSLTASIVDSPAHGSLSNFSGTSGTFTYTPNTSFVGLDTFTYRVNDGTDDSNLVTASIAVGGHFGPRTNLEAAPRDGFLLTGELELQQPLTPGVSLIYDSGTLPQPIVALETFLQDSSTVPSGIDAQLTFNGTAGSTFSYDTTGLSAGDDLRFALQTDASSLATGQYDYSVKLTADMSGTPVDHTYGGSRNVVNRGSSSYAFGRGWQLAGIDELAIGTNGVLWVQDDGDALWFADDGSGGFSPALGDATYSTLVENANGTYTLTSKHGEQSHFSSAGLLTSREDRNGNTIGYSYTGGLLTAVTDPFGRDTTFSYTSGQLTGITDFASRSATLAYDVDGRLTSVTRPDPDGAGSLAAPVFTFGYSSTTHQLTSVTDPLSQTTQYAYGSHDRLTTVTHPDANTWSLSSLQTQGLPTGTTGNSLHGADPTGSTSNERNYTSSFKTDRFGSLTESTNPLGHKTLTERNYTGLPVRLTEADPDGTGSLANPITVYGHDSLGNLLYQRNPDDSTKTWTYNANFSFPATEVDELGRSQAFSYNTTTGNLTTSTDAAGYVTSYTYTTRGQAETVTAPDPDGTGPLASPVTEYAYDSYGRLTTLTNPDNSTRVYTYDSADNRLTDRDELLNTTTWTHDALARVTSVTDRTGGETEYAYNGLGQVTQMLDPFDQPTDYTYHSRGWLSTITRPDPDGSGPLVRPVTTHGYTATGKKASVVQSLFATGTKTEYTYDAADRLDRVDGPWDLVYHDYTYDALGRLIRDDDELMYSTSYEYNSRGWLTKVTEPDPDGGGGSLTSAVTLYAYNAAGEQTSVTDPRGYTTEYAYNSRGLLSSTTLPDPDGSGANFAPTTTYDYDNLGRLITETDPLNRTVNYAYSNRDWVTSITQPDPDAGGTLTSPVTTFGYDLAGNQTSVTDPLSRVTAYAYDAEGRVTSVTAPDPDGSGSLTSPVTSYTYNLAGWMTAETDPSGGVTSYGYDTLGRQTSVTQPDPDGTGPLAAPVTNHYFDNRGLLEKTVDPLSRQTTFQYDEVGRRTGVTDHQGNVTSYTYRRSHQGEDLLNTITEPDPDGTGPLESPETLYAYDALGRMTTVVQPDGQRTEYTYDDAGNRLTLKDPVGNTTSWAYDSLGRMTMETNELSQSRSFYHDAADNFTRKVDRNGRVTQFVHDDLDRLTEEQWRTNATPVPTLAVSTTTGGGVADEVQRVGYTIAGSLSTSGSFTLTFNGQTTSSLAWNASAATVQSALEALSNIGSGDVSVDKLQDTVEAQEWRVSFQGALTGSNVVQTTIDTMSISGFGASPVEIEATDSEGSSGGDETQQVTLSNATDGTFRLAFQGETSAPIAYDAGAASVEATLESLNAVDQVTVTGNVGGPWSVTFTGAHSGQDVSQMQGDAASAASGSLARSLSYAYDAASQLTSASDPAAVYTFVYDDLGRQSSMTHDLAALSSDVEMQASYDAAGNRTQLKAKIGSADDFLSDYSYDALHRMTRVEQSGVTGGNAVAEKRVDFAYTAAGEWDTITRYADLSGTQLVATSSYVYDTLGRLTDLPHAKGAATLADYDWTYDNLGRPAQFVSLTDGTADYSYDQTSQLTDGAYDYQTDEAYSYDNNGNRTNTGYSTDTDNQLLSDGVYNYEYDDEGNRVKKTEIATDEATEYQWDHRNRLVKVVHLDSSGTPTQTLDYTYDVFDRRIGRSDTPAVGPAYLEDYVYDRKHLALEFEAGQLANRYLHGPVIDQILADEHVDSLTSPGDVLWPLTDNLGTVWDLAEYDAATDTTTVANHLTYDAFGGVTAETNAAVGHLFGYTGREWDADADLQYNRARWYDPNVGRWLSQDPIGFEAGDANLYRYVGNEATVNTDPSGKVQAPEPLSDLDYDSRFQDLSGPDPSELCLPQLLAPPPYNQEPIDWSWPDDYFDFAVPDGPLILLPQQPNPPMQISPPNVPPGGGDLGDAADYGVGVVEDWALEFAEQALAPEIDYLESILPRHDDRPTAPPPYNPFGPRPRPRGEIDLDFDFSGDPRDILDGDYSDLDLGIGVEFVW